MTDIKAFLEKVRKDIKGAKVAYIVFDGDELVSIRQTSNKILAIREDELVGVYDATAKDSDIIDDCLVCIDAYKEKQVEQSERLNKALGVA